MSECRPEDNDVPSLRASTGLQDCTGNEPSPIEMLVTPIKNQWTNAQAEAGDQEPPM